MTWETCIDQFFIKQGSSCRPPTLRSYRHRLRLFEMFWEGEYHSTLPEPETLTEEDFLKFLAWIKKRGYNQNYQSRIYGDVVRFLKFCSNPNIKAILAYKPKRSWEQLSYIPTDEEVKRILSVHWKTEVVNVRNRLIIGLLFFTGMKPHEIANLNTDSIKTGEGTYDLLVVKNSKWKWRRVPIPKSCISSKIRDYIADYRLNTDEKALFTTRNGRISPARISNIAREAGNKSGVKKFTCRSARVWLVIRYIENRIPDCLIRRLLGYAERIPLTKLDVQRCVTGHDGLYVVMDKTCAYVETRG